MVIRKGLFIAVLGIVVLLGSQCSENSPEYIADNFQRVQKNSQRIVLENQRLWANNIGQGFITGILYPRILEKKLTKTYFDDLALRLRSFINYNEDGLRAISVYRRDAKKTKEFSHIMSIYVGDNTKKYGPKPVAKKYVQGLEKETALTTFSGSGDEIEIKVELYYQVSTVTSALERLHQQFTQSLK